MKRLLKYSFLLALALGLNVAAYAKHKDPPLSTAPEVDVALATGGLTLVGGTIAVLRARRSK